MSFLNGKASYVLGMSHDMLKVLDNDCLDKLVIILNDTRWSCFRVKLQQRGNH